MHAPNAPRLEALSPDVVLDVLREQPVVDMHTHLYPPSFGTPLGGAGKRSPDADGCCCGASTSW
jgi:hypothetical protein